MRNRFLFMILFSMAFGVSGAISCGSGVSPLIFSISPTQSTVKRGATFQFNTNPANISPITWSVVGGDANGTISPGGLYTAPSTLPINTQVTVQAQASGVTETATVSLVAADDIAFANTVQVSDTPVDLSTRLLVQANGVLNQIGAGIGSVHVYSSWTSGNNSISMTNVSFSKALDFGAFGLEANLTNNGNPNNNSLMVDQNLNPVIFFSTIGGGPLQMVKSNNQGGSFGSPTPVVSPPSGNSESGGNAVADQSNRYHLVFEDSGASQTVKYYRSTDGGGTWSSPAPLPASANKQFEPQIAVSPNGQDIFICYTDGDALLSVPNNIFVAVSHDGGNLFNTTPLTNAPVGVHNRNCDVDLGPNGEVYVTYVSEVASNKDILFQVSTNGGANFNPPKTVNSSTANVQHFSFLSVDSLGRIDVIWGDNNNTPGFSVQIMYARSLNGGASFSSNEAIVPLSSATLVIPMGLVHDEAGRLHIQFLSYINSMGSTYDIFYLMGE